MAPKTRFFGAGTKSRTRDLLITNQLLYQLSYAGFSNTIPLSKTSRTLILLSILGTVYLIAESGDSGRGKLS